MPQREELNYPPFGHLARIVVRSEIESKALQTADKLAETINHTNQNFGLDIRVLGPAPAPVEKLRGKYRFHMLVFSNQPKALQTVISRVQSDIKPIDGVQWIVDIDPQDML